MVRDLLCRDLLCRDLLCRDHRTELIIIQNQGQLPSRVPLQPTPLQVPVTPASLERTTAAVVGAADNIAVSTPILAKRMESGAFVFFFFFFFFFFSSSACAGLLFQNFLFPVMVLAFV
jgi:hypothetical protein